MMYITTNTNGAGAAAAEEEKKASAEDFQIDSYSSIREAMPFNYPVV